MPTTLERFDVVVTAHVSGQAYGAFFTPAGDPYEQVVTFALDITNSATGVSALPIEYVPPVVTVGASPSGMLPDGTLVAPDAAGHAVLWWPRGLHCQLYVRPIIVTEGFMRSGGVVIGGATTRLLRYRYEPGVNDATDAAGAGTYLAADPIAIQWNTPLAGQGAYPVHLVLELETTYEDGTVRDIKRRGRCRRDRHLRGRERRLIPMSTSTAALFVLVPSPLLGPSSWGPVAAELAARDLRAMVTVDLRDPLRRQPAWQATVGGVAATLQGIAEDQRMVLVAHSGAGPLLPAVGGSLAQPVAAYVFVDAGLPHGGSSRLEAIGAEDPEFAIELRNNVETGRRYPAWTDDDLRELVPDPERRRALLAELRPRGLDYWTEPLPLVSGWPNAPCGYLRFSDPYRQAAERARQAGWPVDEIPAGHFHQLVDPAAVVDALIGLLDHLGDAHRAGAATAREEAAAR